MADPYSAPEGSKPATYMVTIKAVIPGAHTDPELWELDALVEHIQDMPWLEVSTVPMVIATPTKPTK